MNVTGCVTGALLLAPILMASGAAAADLPVHRRTIPSTVQGLWGYAADDCNIGGSDGLLTIDDRSVRFFASGYDITRMVYRRDGSMRASGVRSEEGEAGRTQGALTLKRLAPGRLLVVSDDPHGHVYHRCPNPPR